MPGSLWCYNCYTQGLTLWHMLGQWREIFSVISGFESDHTKHIEKFKIVACPQALSVFFLLMLLYILVCVLCVTLINLGDERP